MVGTGGELALTGGDCRCHETDFLKPRVWFNPWSWPMLGASLYGPFLRHRWRDVSGVTSDGNVFPSRRELEKDVCAAVGPDVSLTPEVSVTAP